MPDSTRNSRNYRRKTDGNCDENSVDCLEVECEMKIIER